jgi:NAD(P)-dependent dehydrogenase (short-subunit alcohol dehydrogenase family)/acyl carrier protein
MLEMEMGMDSDLGIDSIKRVEILSAIRERLPDAPPIGPEHLGMLHTLGEIAAYLSAGSSTNSGSGSKAPFIPPATAQSSLAEILLAVVSEKTGYPVDMLEMEMGMDSDLGIDSIKRVEILSAIRERLPDAPLIGPEHLGILRTLGDIAAHLSNETSATAAVPVSVAETVTSHQSPATGSSANPAIRRSAVTPVLLEERASANTITLSDNGEFWVTDDGSPFAADLCAIIQGRGLNVRRICAADAHDIAAPEKISGLIIAAPLGGTDDHFLENAFLLLKNTAPALRRAAADGGALCATVSRLDGALGCGSSTILTDPLSGGLAGLAKTAAREWPEVIFRAIDLGQFPGSAAMARALANELFSKGPLELGLTPNGRTALKLVEVITPPMPVSPSINPGDVVIMTGGGRGVTAAAAIALTEAYRPLLILLGRSPAPKAEPAWLSALGEEAQIKRSIIEHADGKLHPRDIEEHYRAIIAGREIRATLDRIAASGGQAIYRSVDIRDGSAVSAIFDEIRRDRGPIRGIVHGAGILADRLITDKSREQFALVYSTKVEGLRSLLNATREDDLRFLAIFSSITGRFGRVGQVDYAVANEVLNKLVQAEARRRPDCRAVSINWGPWDGGMVTPTLKKVFATEGIGLIDLKEGGEFLIREIAAIDATVEIVAIAGAIGNAEAVPPPARPHSLAEAFSLTLTVDDYPFLRSHVLDGKAVLPMAVIVEWLAHGALHGNPGFRFHGFSDLRICKGVVFGQEATCALRVMAGRAEKRDTFYLVPVELSGTGYDGHAILHARAEIVLATRLPEGIRSIIEIPTAPYLPTKGVLYDRERLFHGPELHGIEQVIGCSAKGIAALVKGAPPPASWIRLPLRSNWITDPLALDSAFQLMILWSFERFGAGSLPCFAGRYRQFIETFPREGVQVVIRVTAEREQSATADMEFLDRHTGKLIARLEDYECVIDPSLKQAFQRNQLAQPGPVQLGAA